MESGGERAEEGSVSRGEVQSLRLEGPGAGSGQIPWAHILASNPTTG